MNCPYCNQVIPDGSATCPNCGAAQQQPQQTVLFCPTCNNQLPPNPVSCPVCGTQFAPQQTVQQPVYQQPMYSPNYAPASGKTNTGYLIWSILNIVLCNVIFGIVALTQTLGAKKAISATDEAATNKKALIWNIVATAIGFVFNSIYIYNYING